jgi:hypothetical protein
VSKKKTIGVEEISAYRTTDGKVFDKFKDAQFHQSELDIGARLAEKPLWGDVYPENMVLWAEGLAYEYSPHEVFVMDVAEYLDEYKVIEGGCFNSAGFYGSDISKIVRDVSVYVENHYEKEKMNF